jgi:serine/threonine-protein kinase
MPPVWPWLLALLVLVLAGLAAAWLLTRDDDEAAPSGTTASERVEVPLLVGLREERALERLQEAGLAGDVEERRAAEAEGVVVEQEPEAGERVEAGGTVRLVVSEGRGGATTGGTGTTATRPETARVPEVVGRRSSEATSILQDAGFGVRVATVPSNEPAGVVVGQNPAAGAEAEQGSEVRLNVSAGEPEPAVVPDTVGQALADAAQAFAGDGLKVSVRFVPSEEPQGTVVAQAREPGTELRRGDTVQVNVSAGPEPAEDVSVPDVAGRPLDEARSALENAGLEVLALDLSGEIRNTDAVASQTPAGGASIPRGALVVLYVTA